MLNKIEQMLKHTSNAASNVDEEKPELWGCDVGVAAAEDIAFSALPTLGF